MSADAIPASIKQEAPQASSSADDKQLQPWEKGTNANKKTAKDRWKFIEEESLKAIWQFKDGDVPLGHIVGQVEVALRAKGHQYALNKPRRGQEPRYTKT